MKRRQVLRGAAAAAVAVGVGAGCSDPPPPPARNVVDPGPQKPSPAPSPTPPAAPLSGEPASGEAVVSRAVLAVPVRVDGGTTPVGLDSADLLFQEYAEAGSLHLAAVFQSRDAARIGPVTEIRPVDVRSLGVLRAFVAYDGGPRGFVDQMTKAGLRGITPGGGSSPFSGSFTSTTALYKVAPRPDLPTPPVFSYADVGTPLATEGVTAASELAVAVPGRPTQVWRYDRAGSTWRGQAGKATVTAASVIVLAMEYRTISVRRPARTMPGAKVFGEGSGLAVSGPSATKVTWRKTGQQAACNVLDSDGYQIRPLPGRAWVVYAPSNAKITAR